MEAESRGIIANDGDDFYPGNGEAWAESCE